MPTRPGYPIDNGNLSVTCLSGMIVNDNMQASLTDAYSTALMAMNLEEAKRFIKNEPVGAYIAYMDGNNTKVYTNIEYARANYEVAS